ncbi:hypothetical protein ACFRJ1_12535 [Streptomyces sp. NPDC056773]|uniref:hypothetical protein n=1 Tax=unclassified Streptomyces TaxID=2593676 RepID=UPI0036A3F775
MTKRTRTRTLAALALTAALAGLGTVPATGAGTAPPGGEATLVAPPSKEPSRSYVRSAGTGLLMYDARLDDTVWTSMKDGSEKVWRGCDHVHSRYSSGDSRACQLNGPTDTAIWGPLLIHDYASDRSETVPSQEGRQWVGPFTSTQVLATQARADGQLTLRLIGRETEPRKDVVIKTTEKVYPRDRFTVVPMVSDDQGSVIWYQDGAGNSRIGLVDYATATMRRLPLPEGVKGPWDMDWPTLSPTRILLSSDKGKSTLLARSDLRKLPSFTGAREGHFLGDWLIREGRAIPVKGGAERTLLPATGGKGIKGSDGHLYVVGGSDAAHWGVHRIALDAQGIPRAKKVRDIPPGPASRSGLSFAQGVLAVDQHDGYDRSLLGFRTSLSGPVSVSRTPAWTCVDASGGDSLCAAGNGGGQAGSSTGDGRIVSFGSRTGRGAGVLYVKDPRTDDLARELVFPGTENLLEHRVVTASGRFVLFEAIGDPAGKRTYVGDIDTGKLLPTPPAGTATALWGSTLWQPEGDKGVVAGTNLRTGKVVRRVNLGTGCRPYELQATAEWFYSTCSAAGASPSGHHVPTKKRVPLPATPMHSDALLGDGFVVREYGEIYNLRSGKAVREFAPAEPVYGGEYAVDRFGGNFAYVDPAQTVHIVGITGKASALTAIDRSIPASGGWSALSSKRWAPRVWLSKPAASWTMAVTDKATGKVVRTLTGGEVRGLLQPMKDGRESPAGSALPGGAYTWVLKVKPADGQGAELALSGSLTLTASTGGAALPAP